MKNDFDSADAQTEAYIAYASAGPEVAAEKSVTNPPRNPAFEGAVPPRSEQERQLNKMQADYFDRFGKAADSFEELINPRLCNKVRLALEKITLTDGSITRIVSHILATRDIRDLDVDIARLTELQAKYEKAMAEAMAHNPMQARKDWLKLQADSHAAVILDESLKNLSVKTFEEFEADYHQKKTQGLLLAKSFVPEARQIVGPHVRRFVSLVNDFADLMAEKEQSRCELFGLKWNPSDEVCSLYKCAAVIASRNGAGHSPKECGVFLVGLTFGNVLCGTSAI